MRQEATANKRNIWFEEKRALWVKNLLKDFHKTYKRFIDLYGQYITSQQVSFEEIDQLVGSENRPGLLWRLKDKCHRLWRDVDPAEEVNGCLLDWVMGSLFHEAMKLKENAYVYQYYRPLAEKMTAGPGGRGLKICGMECERFMERTATEIQKQMENLSLMFGRANYLLRLMMPEQAQNTILLRYLIEHEEVVIQLWSENLTELLADMFFGAPEQGYCAAAKSYLQDHWQERARMAYSKALALNPQCEEAHRYVLVLQTAPNSRDRLVQPS